MNSFRPSPQFASVVVSLLLSACSDSGRSAKASLDGRTLSKGSATAQVCALGQTRSCSLTLSEHDGVISCYEGTQICEETGYSQCKNGKSFELLRSDITRNTRQFKALGDPRECTDNPCNAYCREFLEEPAEGLVADRDLTAPIAPLVAVGNTNDYSETLAATGNVERCHDAADCQLSSRCTDPAVGSCNHSVCNPGEALDADCNRCVTTVCDTQPECCGPVVTCSHDPCQTGVALDSSCDTCTQAVCDAHPECCDPSSPTQWNSACVSYVAEECTPLGQTCGCPNNATELDGVCYAPHATPMEWSLAGDDLIGCPGFGIGWGLAEPQTPEQNDAVQAVVSAMGVTAAWLGAQDVSGNPTTPNVWVWKSDASSNPFYIGDESGGLAGTHTFENWAIGRPTAGSALDAATMGSTGRWSHVSRSSSQPSVCSGPANTLTPPNAAIAWTDSCVALAETACGVSCPAGDAIGLGACVPHVQSELSANCTGYDLTVGATCSEAGTAQIPICNHGQVQAPANLSLRYYSGTALLGQLDPDSSVGTTCTISQPIEPGRCVIVDDCAGISVGDAILVNPRLDASDTSECQFQNNWSIYDDVSCQAPLCEASAQSAALVAQSDCTVSISNPLSLSTDDTLVTLDNGLGQPRCGQDEVLRGTSCYFFADPSTSLARDWLNARQACQDRGAGWDLIAINSPSENLWTRFGFGGYAGEVQIGYNDIQVENTHEWSNETCNAFENWSIGTFRGAQPNDFPVGTHGCSRMFEDNAWGDTACSGPAFPYVCEGPVFDLRGGCAAGQFKGPDGDCYLITNEVMPYSDAEDACNAVGPGWRLAHIRNHPVNNFAIGLNGCGEAWLSPLSDNFSGTFPQSVVLPGAANFSDDPFIGPIGLWQLENPGSGGDKAALCQGPFVPSGSPPLLQVADASACTPTSTREYFFNGEFLGGTDPNDFAPDNLQLCPATCDAARAEPTSTRLDVEVPCSPAEPPAVETVHRQFYESDCEEGGTQWDFLYYDTLTPADSNVEFLVRTGDDPTSIVNENGAFLSVARAQAIPVDTQRCEVDPPNCPIDIFSQLGNPAFQRNTLELEIRMTPGTNGEGPIVRDWRVRYSCPPGE